MALLHKTTVARLLAGATTARRVAARDLARLAFDAMKAGRPFTPGVHWTWDISGACSAPVTVELIGREWRHKGGALRHVVITDTKCRRCPNCLAKRAASWRLRAKAQYQASTRTWFGTLTFAPDVQAMFRAKAQKKVYLRRGPVGTPIVQLTWEELPEAERFTILGRLAGAEVSKYLKRLRKTGAVFQYILVLEAHRSGAPHFHLLIHEKADEIRHKTLTDQWTYGFCNFKLALEERSVTYLMKYLAKSMLARVRASIDY